MILINVKIAHCIIERIVTALGRPVAIRRCRHRRAGVFSRNGGNGHPGAFQRIDTGIQGNVTKRSRKIGRVKRGCRTRIQQGIVHQRRAGIGIENQCSSIDRTLRRRICNRLGSQSGSRFKAHQRLLHRGNRARIRRKVRNIIGGILLVDLVTAHGDHLTCHRVNFMLPVPARGAHNNQRLVDQPESGLLRHIDQIDLRRIAQFPMNVKMIPCPLKGRIRTNSLLCRCHRRFDGIGIVVELIDHPILVAL